LPRDLADVLHHFLPETGPEPSEPSPPPESPPAQRGPARSLAALPIVALPIGDRDVVRAAFAWNLGVEIARLGAGSVVVSPAATSDSTLWPCTGVGPLGAEVVLCPATGLGELYRMALDVAVDRAATIDPEVGGLVLVRVPPPWLRRVDDGHGLLRWSLSFCSGDPSELLETYGLVKLLAATHKNPQRARLGVTLHGVRSIAEARRAFLRLTRTAEAHLQRNLTSYGALVDDLHVYRAIVARRPIGLEHPQSPAARAMQDVASMLIDDALEAIRA
jgi:hypothetical protein